MAPEPGGGGWAVLSEILEGVNLSAGHPLCPARHGGQQQALV